MKNIHRVNWKIYITNDEEIKEGNWFIHSSHGTTTLLKCKSINLKQITDNEGRTCRLEYTYKIILTTDQDLIADGVQAIDDEFLEWFVKNPSCEFVEVKKEKIVLGEVSGTTYTDFKYKLIIPKEEPKQETLEEVAERYYEENIDQSNIPREHYEIEIKDLIIGFAYKWQQEQDKNKYSEQEAFNMLMDFWKEERPGFKTNPVCVSNWFEQFKKK